MLADERAKHLNHCWLICARVPGNALHGENAADPHVELVGADLLDRSTVEVGNLASTRGL